MILDKYEAFIEGILNNLNKLSIDVSDLEMDHIGYQASSDKEYDDLCKEFNTLGEKVSEKLVGGRRVGIYKLFNPLRFKQYTNTAIELVAPKEGQICSSSLEHVEFVIKESFESFIKKYPAIPWNTTAINRAEFPMVTLKLDNNAQVKFHLEPLLEMIKEY